MRQAGRYQPEYRAIREKVSFIELCKSPDLVAEVTTLPVTQLGVDAAILFADILLILEPLGIGFEFLPEGGPKIQEPIRTAKQVDAVQDEISAKDSLDYVMKGIEATKAALPKETPLIGFAGAPFTLASYAIEGGGSKNYHHTKTMMFSDSGSWHALMHKLTDATIDYLNAKIDKGVDAVQLFDSWIGCLSPAQYRAFVEPHMKRLFGSLDDSVPHIHFGTGNPELYPHMAAAGGDVIGVDWRVSIDEVWPKLGEVAIQGNLDAAALLGPRDELESQAKAVLNAAGDQPGHIFNLGHGIMPEASVDQAKALVDCVHEASSR